MNQNDQNLQAMLKSTISVMESHADRWNKVRVIADTVTALKGTDGQIDTTARQQAVNNSAGYTAEKDQCKDEMLRQSLKIGHKVTAWALAGGNQAVLPLTDFSQTSLERGTEAEITHRCRVILETAEKNLPALAAYLVTKADLTNLQAAIDKFAASTRERNLVAGDRKQATRSLPELVAAARELLYRLDKMMDSMVDDPAFVARYHDARQIVDRRKRGVAGKTEEGK